MSITASDLLSTLPDGDWSRRMLEAIFGTTTDASAISSILGIIASALTILGTMWLGYGILSAIVGAARTGRPLSESASGAWAIIRPVVGLGMLVPVVGVGLSGVHYLVRDVAVVSANLGNAVAVEYVENAAFSGKSSLPISGAGQSLVYGIARAEVCAAVRIQAGRILGESSTTAARIPVAAGVAIESEARKSFWTGAVTEAARTTGFAWDYGAACGSITISNPADLGTFGTTRRQAVATAIETIRAMELGTAIADTIGKIPGATSADSDTLSQSLISFWKAHGALVSQLVEQLNETASDYDKAVSIAAKSTASSTDSTLRDKLVAHVKSCGWPCVGGYYRTLATLNLSAASAASERPTVSSPDAAAWGIYSSTIGAALKLIDNQIFSESSDIRLTSDDLRTQADDDAQSTFSKVVSSITEPLKDYFTQYDGFSADPISDLMNTGNGLLVASETAFGVATVAMGGAHFFGSSAGAVLDFLMRAGWPAIAAAYGSGVMLQYVLPLIPWIYVTFSFFAWGLEILVASIAVLIWAFGHLRLDGGSFVDRAQAFGYGSLFVSILLRPATIVVAYVAAIGVSIVGLNFLRFSLSFASDAAMTGFTLGVSGALVYGILTIVVQFAAFHYIFRSIPSAPERIGAWLGLTISSWRDSEGGTVIMGAVGGRLGGMGRGGMPGLQSGGKTSGGGTSGAGASSGAGVSRPTA